MNPEARMNPEGTRVALRFSGERYWTAYEGKGYFEKFLTDEDLATWIVLAAPRHVERVTCPWCGRNGRALDERGRIRWHFAHTPGFYTDRCQGTGRLPSDYRAAPGGV
ncbi:hypothetical protein [Lentzea cavernae]|uniref:Competence protein CoiA-like family protein n=1 Tax=Lentzea cavernae TaxID=2020703 RepID=A0ABQ3MSG3_9PSEU|nr:hypothetical protein [Lentzea cavernae]GHH57424.1 hypothetical protein GCM10017774_76890 [Lentzea cavernae]